MRRCARRTPGATAHSFRERVRPQLELDHLARGPLPGLHVKWRTGAHRTPEAAALPAAVRLVDASVHPLRVVPGRVWHSKDHPLPVLQDQEAFGFVTRVDWRVLAQ